MICLKCGCEEGRVINSREKEEYTYRRRECLYCGNRFTTAEIHIEEYERLKSGREKLQYSIERLNCAADAMNGLLIDLKALGVEERRQNDERQHHVLPGNRADDRGSWCAGVPDQPVAKSKEEGKE